MVMQCGVKRKRSQLDNYNNGEHQKSLLELSIHKLQEEQAKYGIEPRLLRFVLVNNALKALQLHMSKLEEDEFCLFDYEDSFLSNTFSHGVLSSPVSPPTPVKVARSNELFSSHSPLVNSSSCSVVGICGLDLENDEVFGLSAPLSPYPHNFSTISEEESTDEHIDLQKEATPLNNDTCSKETPILGTKRTSSSEENEDLDNNHSNALTPTTKRRKLNSDLRPNSLSLVVTTTTTTTTTSCVTSNDSLSPSSSSSSNTSLSSSLSLTTQNSNSGEECLPISSPSSSSSSLSPIDFSNVDVSLYDFDARAALTLPPPPVPTVTTTSTGRTPSSLSISSCALETFIKPLENGISTTNSDSSTCSDVHSCSQSNGFTSNQSSPLVGVSKVESTDVESLDDIERIVSLLIT